MTQITQLATQVLIRGRPIKFTPERIQQIKNLVERGKNREEIAELIGVTVGSLQVTCSRFGISLRRPTLNNGTISPRREEPRFNRVSTPGSSGSDGALPQLTIERPEKHAWPGPAEQAPRPCQAHDAAPWQEWGKSATEAVMMRIIFSLMDSDGDGTISLQEFQAAHERIFKAMDANKDGRLTQEEMQAFMQLTRRSVPPQ